MHCCVAKSEIRLGNLKDFGIEVLIEIVNEIFNNECCAYIIIEEMMILLSQSYAEKNLITLRSMWSLYTLTQFLVDIAYTRNVIVAVRSKFHVKFLFDLFSFNKETYNL